MTCFAPWCGIDGKYANPGVCNVPGGHAYKAPASRTDEAPRGHEPNGAKGGIPSEAGKPAGPASTNAVAARGSREIAEALGFEPDNHHNAAACPYCTNNGTFVTVRRDDLNAVVSQLEDWGGSHLGAKWHESAHEVVARLRSALSGSERP